MKNISLTIDGKEVKAKEGMTVLQAAKTVGIEIPTLCNHEDLDPYGACRLCAVEVVKNNRVRLVAACCYPVEEGLIVKTSSERVNKIRKIILELLLPLAPTGPLYALAEKYGLCEYIKKSDEESEWKLVKELRFPVEKPTYCTLCGLCVRYCAEIKKGNVIGFVGRGVDRKVSLVPEENCGFCRDCENICEGGKFFSLLEL